MLMTVYGNTPVCLKSEEGQASLMDLNDPTYYNYPYKCFVYKIKDQNNRWIHVYLFEREGYHMMPCRGLYFSTYRGQLNTFIMKCWEKANASL